MYASWLFIWFWFCIFVMGFAYYGFVLYYELYWFILYFTVVLLCYWCFDEVCFWFLFYVCCFTVLVNFVVLQFSIWLKRFLFVVLHWFYCLDLICFLCFTALITVLICLNYMFALHFWVWSFRYVCWIVLMLALWGLFSDWFSYFDFGLDENVFGCFVGWCVTNVWLCLSYCMVLIWCL